MTIRFNVSKVKQVQGGREGEAVFYVSVCLCIHVALVILRPNTSHVLGKTSNTKLPLTPVDSLCRNV